MRKKTLLSMPQLLATDEMIRTARADKGVMKKVYSWESKKHLVYRHDIYVRACVGDGILKTAFFSRPALADGGKAPLFEVYISAEEEKHLTWIAADGKWSEGKIGYQNIGVQRWAWSSLREDWEEEGARQLVNEYLGYRNADSLKIYDAVDRYQKTLEARKLRGRHQREKALIDLAMEQVPDLPADWTDWVYHSAYSKAMYMMYRPGDPERKAYCTACGKELQLKKRVRHLEQMKCPACHAEASARSWNKQKTMGDWKKPGILQKRKDGSGYVLRVFESKIWRSRETGWRVGTNNSFISEKYRVFLDRQFRPERRYEYALWKNRYENEMRWCYKQNSGYYCEEADECVLYFRNLKQLRRGTCLKYMPIEALFRHCQGWYSYVEQQLYSFRERPQLEYLLKLKLYRLVWDLTRRGGIQTEMIDWNQKKPWAALRIDREQLDMAVKMDITEIQLKTLQTANARGIRLTRKQLEWYARELGPSLMREALRYGHAEKTMKYIDGLKKDSVAKVGDYMDYLEEIRTLQIPPTDDVLFPKNFMPAHERTAEQVREKKEEIKKAELEEKDRILRSMLPSLREIYAVENAGYLMVLPTCKEDFRKEGRENHNCVGGSYFDKMLEGRSVVLFLRKPEDPGKAFCTVEMDGANVLQCRAVRNSPPPEEVRAFMERYSREVQKRLDRKAKEELARILATA